jgi:hypothetical protein
MSATEVEPARSERSVALPQSDCENETARRESTTEGDVYRKRRPHHLQHRVEGGLKRLGRWLE